MIKQNFTNGNRLRSALILDDDNPRMIEKSSLKRLEKSLKEYGLVQPITINKLNNRVLGGHQRLFVMDKIQNGVDYLVPTCEIECEDRAAELKINLLLNNQEMSGDFDYEKIRDLVKDFNIDLGDVGFSLNTINALDLGVSMDNLDDLIPVEFKKDLATSDKKFMTEQEKQAVYDKVDEQRKEYKEKAQLENLDKVANYLIVTFPTFTEKNEFLEANELDPENNKIKFDVLKEILTGDNT